MVHVSCLLFFVRALSFAIEKVMVGAQVRLDLERVLETGDGQVLAIHCVSCPEPELRLKGGSTAPHLLLLHLSSELFVAGAEGHPLQFDVWK